jgi:hypothetical protein
MRFLLVPYPYKYQVSKISTLTKMSIFESIRHLLWRVSTCGIWRRVVRWVSTDACHVLACWFAEHISSTLKMEAIYSSETSVETQRTTRRHIPEDDTLHNHRCENLISYTKIFFANSSKYKLTHNAAMNGWQSIEKSKLTSCALLTLTSCMI